MLIFNEKPVNHKICQIAIRRSDRQQERQQERQQQGSGPLDGEGRPERTEPAGQGAVPGSR